MTFSPTAPQDPRQLPMFDGSTPVKTMDANIEIDKTTGEVVSGDLTDDNDNDVAGI